LKFGQFTTGSQKDSPGDQAPRKSAAETAFQAAVPVLDHMARKGLIHKNKAARYKSRFNSQIRAL